jgi:eukaryotic-like serine/threonine-protein kinase
VSTRIGDYALERELARGGMGVVYVATHVQLGRRVALKQMLAGDDRDAHRRFQIEAEALAKLNHPNIVRVHEVGVSPKGGSAEPASVSGRVGLQRTR